MKQGNKKAKSERDKADAFIRQAYEMAARVYGPPDMLPQVGERWRWSYCESPDWCCGGEGVIGRIEMYEGSLSYIVFDDDGCDLDAFKLDHNRPLRVEKL